jgi:hypothetical protein
MPRHTHATGDNAAKVEVILGQIEARRLDITEGYATWFSIGCALAKEFGENGRDYFHRTSQYNLTYHGGDTDQQFSNCLRMRSNQYSLGTFFEIARRHGIEYKTHFQSEFTN